MSVFSSLSALGFEDTAIITVDPHIGGPGIWNNLEVLSWGTDGHLQVVLVIIVVGHQEFGSVFLLVIFSYLGVFKFQSVRVRFDHLLSRLISLKWNDFSLDVSKKGENCKGVFHY